MWSATTNLTAVILAETDQGTGNPGRGGRVLSEGRRGRGRDQMAQGLSAADRLQAVTGAAGILNGEPHMAKTNQRTPRKPATKFPNLQKKLQKGKGKASTAKTK